MERNRAKYFVLSISDGLFLGLGLSLGVSFFNEYSFTFISVLLVGITGALSNMFAVYNAESFTSGLQLLEYKRFMFAKEYNPTKLAKSKHRNSVVYATESFVSTIVGSLIVLVPYIAFFSLGNEGIRIASVTSLLLSLVVLAFIGSYNQSHLRAKIKGALKTSGIGLAIASLSAGVGFLLSVVL